MHQAAEKFRPSVQVSNVEKQTSAAVNPLSNEEKGASDSRRLSKSIQMTRHSLSHAHCPTFQANNPKADPESSKKLKKIGLQSQAALFPEASLFRKSIQMIKGLSSTNLSKQSATRIKHSKTNKKPKLGRSAFNPRILNSKTVKFENIDSTSSRKEPRSSHSSNDILCSSSSSSQESARDHHDQDPENSQERQTQVQKQIKLVEKVGTSIPLELYNLMGSPGSFKKSKRRNSTQIVKAKIKATGLAENRRNSKFNIKLLPHQQKGRGSRLSFIGTKNKSP